MHDSMISILHPAAKFDVLSTTALIVSQTCTSDM